MIKRPKPGEDEDDILKMQEEFLREKNKNENWQPAAQVVNLRPTEPTKRPTTEPATRKPSKYAKAKGLGNTEKRVTFDSANAVLGDILEKNVDEPKKEVEDDKVYYPKVIPSVLGNIVEKNIDNFDLEFKPMPSQGFPVATKRDSKAQALDKTIKKQNEPTEMDIDIPSTSKTVSESNKLNLPAKSYVVTSKEAEKIHTENVRVLEKMSEKEILDEQQKLLSSLDPKLVEFIKSKRNTQTTDNKSKPTAKQDISTRVEKMDTSEPTPAPIHDTLWENDILSHPEVNKWLHFDSLEKDKFEWMKGVEESKKINPDEPYEARFDFKGYLLPYTMEYTEATKPLFHHGEESHRPGYTITELIELSRSSVTQQRVMALNTIAGILEYYSVGTYKDVLDIPLSKIFFIIRIAMDENKVIILEPALKAMRNLLYNQIDEASLDALTGFEEGTNQPCLENDKSEIAELQSEESELKDFHLAEVDIITAVLRTNILQRMYYILDTIKPSFNCVQYCLQILTRLARDSVDTAQKILEADHLMHSIIKNFIPVTGINFVFDPNIVYNGKPVLAALKLIRVLSLQSIDIAGMLISKYNILNPISMYISSGVERSYGLRIQTEAHSILSNILHYGLGVDCALSLSPVIITALYKHVQGTDIFIESSILSATHAAVVLQLVNKLLNCKVQGFDQFKTQVYPLLKEGVQKWIAQLCSTENYKCAHLRMLCSALDCCKTVLLIENVPVKFFNNSLKQLANSKGFERIIKNVVLSSNLLSSIEEKDLHVTKNLMSLRCFVIDSDQKVLPILNEMSPIPFLGSLFKLLAVVDDKEISQMYLKCLHNYLKKLANNNPSLCDNWFTRMETDFVFNILKISINCDVTEGDKDLLYAVANRLCYILRIDKKYELDFLFSNIVFNKNWFTAERLLNLVNLTDADGFSRALTSIEDIKKCYSQVIKLNYEDTGPNVVLRKWMEPILPRDWIYLPILMLYSKSQEPDTKPIVVGEHAKRISTQQAAEKEFIVASSLEWILFNEICFADLNDIDATDRFCRIMCVFLCDNSLFLDPKIKLLLHKCTQLLFKKRKTFNFDKELTGLHNFQDFYTQFLEQFQSVSYGDPTFAACVLVPLAQRHNVKWRKLLWSEYAGCLRALDCPKEYLCYDLQEYLYPEETDESLLKSYFQALSGNLLRPDTIASNIANHHVECLKKRSNINS
ncbi:hypothetical protein O3G_MSEX002660 [Manduca sexta]|uniref:RNA polymerase II-associated protein 1 n=1 Tax=Manduca sexta TaxID=7130 RepID=A0A921YQU3_MANSE|nr:hypothetical protein O3G_MSEX002660 [Manduca sexta]